MVFISKEDYMFRPIAAIFRFGQFSAKIVLYNIPKPRGDEISSSVCLTINNSTQNDDEISTSPRGLGTLYKTLLA